MANSPNSNVNVVGRRERKKDERKQQILSAASELFGAKGYEETSMEDIANLADVSRGTVFYNFASKEQIVIDLRLKSVQDASAQALSKLEEGMRAIDALEFFIVETCLWTEKNAELAQILIMQGPVVQSLIPAELLIKAQEEESLDSDLDLHWLTAIFTFVMEQGQLTWLTGSRKKSASSLVKKMFSSVLKGVSAQG